MVLALIQAWGDAPTWDEGIYIAAGVTTLTRHQVRIDIEHPPLAKVAAALPALLVHPVIPDVPSFRAGREFDYAGTFVEANRRAGKLRRVVFVARLVPIAEAVAVAVVMYVLGAHLFGAAAGLVAAAVWLTNPFFLGLGHVGNLDVPAALTAVALALALTRLLERPSWARTVAVGAVVGGAMMVRSTGLLLAPLAAIGAAVAFHRPRALGRLSARGFGRAVGAAAVVLVVGWMSVWIGMRALSPHPWPPPAAADREVVIAHAAAKVPASARVATTVPWPREYADGIRYLAIVSTPPGPGFILGRAWDGGRWWYWPAAMLVKLPATTLVALVAGWLMLIALLRSHLRSQRRVIGLALVLPAVVLTAFVMTQPRDQGLRYLAPALALGAVLASPVARVAATRVGRGLLAVALTAQLVALVASNPHSLTWTTPPFGPPYRVEADANLDWNQDFYRLQHWAQGKQPWVAYFGLPSFPLSAVPGARQLLGVDPHTVQGWVAVSGSILTTYNRNALSWLRAYCPVGTLGGSIVLYRLDGPPDTRPGPTAPARECRGAFSRRTR